MNFTASAQPKISIVIASWNGMTSLQKCLESLETQTADFNAEVIAVSNFENGIAEVKKEFQFAKFIILSSETSVPELRKRGILESKGEIIALTEDLCTFDENWCREIEKAHLKNYKVIGGAVDNSHRQNALDWAVYFFDYGKYMPPNPAGASDSLSEINISYKKETLEQFQETYLDGFYEASVNTELKRCGLTLFLTPSAIVFHSKNYEFGKICSQFYHQARVYAARRVFRLTTLTRFFYASVSIILPFLLSFRIIIKTVKKNRNLNKLAISLPYLIILTGIWTFGEFCGYLNGEGKSARHWK